MQQTKERLRLEVADWIKRSQHEAKMAFAEGDLWTALAWGAKVPEFVIVDEAARVHAYETGVTIDELYERVGRIVREIDPYDRIKKTFDSLAMIGRTFHVGIDFAPGPSATAIATLFRESVEKMNASLRTRINSCIVHTAEAHELEAKALSDLELSARARAKLRERMSGKSVDHIILDDPLKE